MNSLQPNFQDDEDESVMNKAREIVRNELTEQKMNRSKDMSLHDKVEKIRRRMERYNFDNNSCPNCHRHNLKVDGDKMKCTGPNCGTEFLMVEKDNNEHKIERKDWICSDCGHTVSTDEAKSIVNNDNGVCPLCDAKDPRFSKIDWNKINRLVR